jgi:hypothetical protein
MPCVPALGCCDAKFSSRSMALLCGEPGERREICRAKGSIWARIWPLLHHYLPLRKKQVFHSQAGGGQVGLGCRRRACCTGMLRAASAPRKPTQVITCQWASWKTLMRADIGAEGRRSGLAVCGGLNLAAAEGTQMEEVSMPAAQRYVATQAVGRSIEIMYYLSAKGLCYVVPKSSLTSATGGRAGSGTGARQCRCDCRIANFRKEILPWAVRCATAIQGV